MKTVLSTILAKLVYVLAFKEFVNVGALFLMLIALALFQTLYIRLRLKQLHPDELLRN